MNEDILNRLIMFQGSVESWIKTHDERAVENTTNISRILNKIDCFPCQSHTERIKALEKNKDLEQKNIWQLTIAIVMLFITWVSTAFGRLIK